MKGRTTMKLTTKNLALTALFIALCTLVTMFIRIPLPTSGYANLGDAMVLLAAWVLGPVYGALAAGLGSALADLIGYPIYAPATFIIKFLVAFFAAKLLSRYTDISFIHLCVIGCMCELIMIAGYYVYDAILLHNILSPALNLPGNIMQAVVGVLVAAFLYRHLSKFIKKYNIYILPFTLLILNILILIIIICY